MNGHPQVRDALGGYALDALEPAEARAVEAHLESCEECRAELAALRRVVAGIGLSVTPEAPPPALKARVLAQAMAQGESPAPVRFTRRPRWRQPAVLALAASIALAAAVSIWALSLRTEMRSLEQTLAVLTAPDTVRVELRGQAGAPAAAGRAWWSTSRGLVFNAERLPALDAARVYQLWTIHNGTPVSAGLLRLEDRKSVV